MTKRLVVFLLLIFALTSSIACSKIKPKAQAPAAQKVFWGNKEEIITFLKSDHAQSERWIVEAVGE